MKLVKGARGAFRFGGSEAESPMLLPNSPESPSPGPAPAFTTHGDGEGKGRAKGHRTKIKPRHWNPASDRANQPEGMRSLTDLRSDYRLMPCAKASQ
jgi:hypothetical protein